MSSLDKLSQMQEKNDVKVQLYLYLFVRVTSYSFMYDIL